MTAASATPTARKFIDWIPGRISLMLRLKWARSALVFAALAPVAGCDKQQADREPRLPPGQIVAHVLGEDVSVLELNNELRLAGVSPDKRDDATTKRALAEVVQRKFLARKAVAAKLDREPMVLLDTMRAREQILAAAYLQKTVSDKWITEANIYLYQHEHPLQFEQRQIIAIDEITVPLTGADKEMMEATQHAKSLEELERKLTALGVTYHRGEGEISSADVSADLFNMAQRRKPDDVFFISRGASGVFFVVKRIELKPFTGEPAKEAARRGLLAQLWRAEAAKALAGGGEIKFEGDYARIMSLPDPGKIEPNKETAVQGKDNIEAGKDKGRSGK